MTGFKSKRQAAQAKVRDEMQAFYTERQAERDKLQDEPDMLLIVYQRGFADGKAAQRKPLTAEPYEPPYNPTPVEYQYHYPDGSWRCSNGDAINGMRPDRARSLYALKDNT